MMFKRYSDGNNGYNNLILLSQLIELLACLLVLLAVNQHLILFSFMLAFCYFEYLVTILLLLVFS